MKTYVFSDEHNCDHTYVLAADAQRALDAERERVAFLDKKNVALVEASNLVLKVKAEQDAQLATLQAQVKQLGRTLADVYQQRDGLQAQLADRDAMILQMGEQAAVLAKENMAVKAQLRQVEGENELLKSGQRYMALGKERDTLRQLVEEADELYTHYGLLANPGYTGPINIFEWIGKVRAAKDAGKETDNGL